MARPSIRAWAFFVILVVLALSTQYASYALVQRETRQGELDSQEAIEGAQYVVTNSVISQIESDFYYGPGRVSATITDISTHLKLHTRLDLFDASSCFGEDLGTILGYDLAEVYANNMLSVVGDQITNAFGSGVVVEGVGVQKLMQEGISAQFYYWVETIGGPNTGGDTPNTDATTGHSDNSPKRQNELSIIIGTSHEMKSSIVNKTTNSTTFFNKRQALNYNTKGTIVSNVSMGNRGHKSGAIDCPPYNFALFTSLYDINVLSSASSDDGFPNTIISPNNQYRLMLQNDCNLVLYKTQYEGTPLVPIWACGDACYNKGTNCFARINLDGTFAVYDGDGNNLWYSPSRCSSGPGCWSDTYLTMQDDGNLVLYLLDTGVAIWATDTYT